MNLSTLSWFPLDRVSELEEAISGLIHDPKTERDGIACMLGMYGLRVGEVCIAEYHDLQTMSNRLFVRTEKGGNPRTITIHKSLVNAIMRWRANNPPKAGCPYLLYTQTGKRVHTNQYSRAGRMLLQRLGCGNEARFHMFRHTFAMRLYERTKDLSLVQQKLGHKNIMTTQVYARSLAEIPEECMVQVADVCAIT